MSEASGSLNISPAARARAYPMRNSPRQAAGLSPDDVRTPEAALHVGEEHGALEQGLVQLRRMAGQDQVQGSAGGPLRGKITAQGTSVTLPQSSPLMKLATRPKKRPAGAADTTRSPRWARRIPWDRVTRKRHGHADHAAMAGHPPVPDPQQRPGLGQKVVRPIEEKIPEPASHQGADDDRDHEVADLLRRQARPPGPGIAREHEGGGEKPDEVGKPVIADAEISPMRARGRG